MYYGQVKVVHRGCFNYLSRKAIPVCYHPVRKGIYSCPVSRSLPQNHLMVTEGVRSRYRRWNDGKHIVDVHSDDPVKDFVALNRVSPAPSAFQ